MHDHESAKHFQETSHGEPSDLLGSILTDMDSSKTKFHQHQPVYLRGMLPSVTPEKAKVVNPINVNKERVANPIGWREREKLQAKARSQEEQEQLSRYSSRQQQEENSKVLHYGQGHKEKPESRDRRNEKRGRKPDEVIEPDKKKQTKRSLWCKPRSFLL